MRRVWLWVVLTCGCCGVDCAWGAAEDELCVMTMNVLIANPRPPHSWPERRPILRDCVRSVAPDLIGTQEGTYTQVREITADLPEYEWIGLGTEGGSRGGVNAIFFRKDRFEPLGFDYFWLSDTPEVIGSNTWGGRYTRMATWVEFADRRSGRHFYLVNTHFDHVSEVARAKSASLLRQRLSQLKPGHPVILTGDFNCPASSSRAHEILTEGGFMADSWLQAKEHRGTILDSFHGFEKPQNTGRRIDWILLRGGIGARSAQVVDFARDGQFPSDHFPVATWLEFEQAAGRWESGGARE